MFRSSYPDQEPSRRNSSKKNFATEYTRIILKFGCYSWPNQNVNTRKGIVLTDQYRGFKYRCAELKKYLSATTFFTIMLKSGEVIHYEPEDMVGFRTWLEQNGVADIRENESW